MFSEENSRKAQSGVRARMTLEAAVADLRADGLILERQKRPSYGYKGYEEDQFYVPEVITLLSGERVLLYSTNSIRTDRTKENQWDAVNIKAIDDRVSEAWIVVPNEEALRGAYTFRERIRSKSLYSAIDDIVTVEEFSNKVCQYAELFLRARSGELDEESASYNISLLEELEGGRIFSSDGSRHDSIGRNFEGTFAAILDNKDNIRMYQSGLNNAGGYHFNIFCETMRAIGVDAGLLLGIEATSQIPKLPNGGSPKADVLAKITTVSSRKKQVREVTFSCKSSSQKNVSVHEYTADAFADVLDPENEKLRALLNAFQRSGSMSGMPDGAAVALSKELHPYREKLDMWVMGGYGASDVLPTQCAQYLVVHNQNTDKVHIHSVAEYCDVSERKNNGRKGFGTIFSWTYPSDRRGKRIQLKADILWE